MLAHKGVENPDGSMLLASCGFGVQRGHNKGDKPLLIAKKNTCIVQKALLNNFWVSQINTQHGLSLGHIQEFALLWERVSGINLVAGVRDTILWKLSTSGEYSASSAYMGQFEGHLKSSMNMSV